MRFIVIADSHIRFPDDDVLTYPSNALMVGRNEYVVDLCNRVDASFVVHLGDIVHPLPVENAHEPAVQLAADVYRGLRHPVHFVAGNHDIGDKPNAWVAVPPVADENYAVYENYWGPAYRSFDVDGCHYVVVDTPVLNSGLEREHSQQRWLEHDLAAAAEAGLRIFVFTHYPPFVREHDEPEHYDNLGEPARSWLLDLVSAHEVEAVFAGHVHNFLYNRHRATDLYVLPSTGFVRPDYAELAAVAPEGEFGRDDPAKLGFFIVDVGPGGHEVRPVRTHGAASVSEPAEVSLAAAVQPDWTNPLGVTLRHGWMSSVEFPTAGLDEFGRKTVRNDASLLALWEARIREVRIPIGDVMTPAGAARVRHLASRGMRFTVRSAGVPAARARETMAELAGEIARWELVLGPDHVAAAAAILGGARLPSGLALAVAPVVALGSPGAEVHHFVTNGFTTVGDGSTLDQWLEHDPSAVFADVVFRVDSAEPIAPAVGRAQATAHRAGRRAVVNVELPRAGESTEFTGDDLVAARVVEALAAARTFPDAAVFLDAFMDHDRGYYPRHGLIDRRANPRFALARLVAAAAGTAGPSTAS